MFFVFIPVHIVVVIVVVVFLVVILTGLLVVVTVVVIVLILRLLLLCIDLRPALTFLFVIIVSFVRYRSSIIRGGSIIGCRRSYKDMWRRNVRLLVLLMREFVLSGRLRVHIRRVSISLLMLWKVFWPPI